MCVCVCVCGVSSRKRQLASPCSRPTEETFVKTDRGLSVFFIFLILEVFKTSVLLSGPQHHFFFISIWFIIRKFAIVVKIAPPPKAKKNKQTNKFSLLIKTEWWIGLPLDVKCPVFSPCLFVCLFVFLSTKELCNFIKYFPSKWAQKYKPTRFMFRLLGDIWLDND